MGLRWIAVHVSFIYLYGALDKLDGPRFAGDRLERLWTNFYRASDAPSGPFAHSSIAS